MAAIDIPLALLVSFSVSFFSVFLLKRLAVKIKLVDTPDHRKTHVGQVPLVGGISIFLGISASFLFFPNSGAEITAFLIAAVLIVVVGLLDDHFELKVRYRLLAQLIAALIITVGSGVTIESLGIFGTEGRFELGMMSIPFTVFSIMVAMSAFNFLDGIDGLSGMLFMVAMLAIISMCIRVSGSELSNYIVPLIFLIAVIPYMVLNLGILGGHHRVFLGDAGSMLLGLAAAWLIIRYTQGRVEVFSPVTGLWFIAVPLMDMLAIVIRRSVNRKAPFQPDRNHLHHLFMNYGLGDRHALLVISVMSVVCALIGVFAEIYAVPEGSMLIAFLLIFFIYYQVTARIEKKQSGAAAPSNIKDVE